MKLSRIHAPLAAVALALGAAASFAVPAQAAEAGTLADPGFIQSFEIGGPLTLDGNGLVAYVPVSITCSGASPAISYVGVNLRQTRGQDVITARGSVPLTCDGTAQNLVVTVTAEGQRFLPREVYATAEAQACDAFGNECSFASDAELTRLQKA
ncbi:hypothetical protein [Micromonospora mirobrigensis]|uniref:Neocarzinostatin family protein n=1 Tax=Micromonospora mirobrigensis TaxID=262898 RepID=A0A1C4ZIC6_9ACTN|nr:hypothetical protein [Micromonospora mirobrigensis]SCF32629.1 hypothetical protein GA0070564_105487 [Micromonospora mirobrigensis]